MQIYSLAPRMDFRQHTAVVRSPALNCTLRTEPCSICDSGEFTSEVSKPSFEAHKAHEADSSSIMAGTISKISGSLAAVHNENNATLANLNLDFTLVKLEAPAEYTRLGTTISRKRKTDAEEGTLHRTVRRLGALFGECLPQLMSCLGHMV